MMKMLRFLLVCVAGLLTTFTFARDPNAPLTAAGKTFLTQYEAVRAALAADDLDAARKAASVLAKAPDGAGATNADAAAVSARGVAKKLAAADTLKQAREAFKSLSKQAVAVAAGQDGYYRAHCPMVPNDEGDWVQTTKTISNPYFGKSMLTCGSIE